MAKYTPPLPGTLGRCLPLYFGQDFAREQRIGNPAALAACCRRETRRWPLNHSFLTTSCFNLRELRRRGAVSAFHDDRHGKPAEMQHLTAENSAAIFRWWGKCPKLGYPLAICHRTILRDHRKVTGAAQFRASPVLYRDGYSELPP